MVRFLQDRLLNFQLLNLKNITLTEGNSPVYRGDKKLFYHLRDIEAVCDIIVQSKNLTSLKIKALNLDTTNYLVSIALKACPKLIRLEIVENPKNPAIENTPKPTFQSMGLQEHLLENMTYSVNRHPTMIQNIVIPCVLAGRDLMGCAQIGAGKAAAFLLP